MNYKKSIALAYCCTPSSTCHPDEGRIQGLEHLVKSTVMSSSKHSASHHQTLTGFKAILPNLYPSQAQEYGNSKQLHATKKSSSE